MRTGNRYSLEFSNPLLLHEEVVMELGSLRTKTGPGRWLDLAYDDEAPLLTDAEMEAIHSTSGSNTGDQDLSGYATTSHTHVLASGATDVTATAAELNLIDLSGLTAGWVLSADTATTASWKAQSGGGISIGDVYPVGSVYISIVSTNPATLFGMGTWAAFGTGRMLIGIDSGDTDFDTAEETGGSKDSIIFQENLPDISTEAGTAHTHTQNSHTHVLSALMRTATTGGDTTYLNEASDASSTKDSVKTTDATTATNQDEATHTHALGGAGVALNVMNPYIAVYMWKRTA